MFSVLLFVLGLMWFSPDISREKDSDWMKRRINQEFLIFEKEGISKELLEKTWKVCQKKKEFLRFQIIDSQVHGPECRVKHLLNALVQKFKVPDVDFIYYNEDRIRKSVFQRKEFRGCAPIFVSAKHRSLDRAILFSDWVYDVDDQDRGWNFLIQTMNALYSQCPWDQKKEVVLWRGTPWDGKNFQMYTFENWTTLPRGKLVFESRKKPDLIDAAFSEYPERCLFDLDRCKKEMGDIQFVPWEETLSYKYQIALDGVTCSFPATQWKLLSGCLTFKQESSDIMYFYDEMIPWTHYIPVRNDLSDLQEKIQWAKDHDEMAHQIAENGRAFVLEHLMPDHILLYCYQCLLKYASLQKFTPEKVVY